MKKTKATTYSRSVVGWIRKNENAKYLFELERLGAELGKSLYKSKNAMFLEIAKTDSVKVKMTVTVKVEPI